MLKRTLMIVTLALVSCGSEQKGSIGDTCTRKGTSDECVAGAICDTVKDTRIICLKSCERDEECSASESCSGVSGGTGKACHEK